MTNSIIEKIAMGLPGGSFDLTEDIYNGNNTKAARKIPSKIWNIAYRKLDMINAANELKDLLSPPGNKLEKLKGLPLT